MNIQFGTINSTLNHNSHRWFPTHSTLSNASATTLTASPIKGAIVWGGAVTGLTAGLSQGAKWIFKRIEPELAQETARHLNWFTLGAAVVVGSIGALAGYSERATINNQVAGLLKRVGVNATVADYNKDPVIKAAREEAAHMATEMAMHAAHDSSEAMHVQEMVNEMNHAMPYAIPSPYTGIGIY